MEVVVDALNVTGKIVTEAPNIGGYFKLPSYHVLVEGYANLGILPVAVMLGDRLLVGIGICPWRGISNASKKLHSNSCVCRAMSLMFCLKVLPLIKKGGVYKTSVPSDVRKALTHFTNTD